MANNKIITLALALVLAASFVSAFAISAFTGSLTEYCL